MLLHQHCWCGSGTLFQSLLWCTFDRYVAELYHEPMSSTVDPALGITLLPPITDRQLQVLSVIHRMVVERQAYPTQRELGQALGMSQPTAGQFIDALTRKGYLSKALGEARRNIRLTPIALERLKGQEGQASLL